MIAAIDGSQTGDIKTTKWAVKGDRVRLLVAGHRRHARLSDRQRLAAEGLRHRDRARSCGDSRSARSQKAPPVLADGKIYVGTESGKFFIVRPACGPRRDPERGASCRSARTAAAARRARRSRFSPARPISRGRIFFVSSDAVYAIGPKTAKRRHRLRGRRAGGTRRGRAGVPAGRLRPSSC